MNANESVEIDFESWLTPAQALALRPSGRELEAHKRWICRRLASGQIRAVAANFSDAIQSQAGGPTTIATKLWSEPWRKLDGDFWETGDITFTDALPLMPVISVGNSRGLKPTQRINLFDVRLDPAAFPQSGDERTDVEEGESDAGPLTPLAEAEAKRFLRVYLAVFGNGVAEAQALTAIRASFPEHTVSRDRFREILRELRGPGKLGKPPTRGK
jgi:hypothetical protein